MNKKGSLSLSINAIIVIVIAFVFLGLGLNFIRTQLGGAGETASMVQEQIKQGIMDDLRTGNKKLSFPAQTLTMEKGSSEDIAIGIKNVLDGDLVFVIDIETTQHQGEKEATAEDLANAVEFFYAEGPFTLKSTDAEAYNIKLIPGAKGTYLVDLKITDTNNAETPYAQKTFFVTVI